MDSSKSETTKPAAPAKKTVVTNPAPATYGLAFIGALVYYLKNADSAQEVVLGILKAIVWPAILTYRVLEFLQL